MRLLAPAPVGDVLDRITILEIKVARLRAENARNNAQSELSALLSVWQEAGLPAPALVPEYSDLQRVNLALWDVEDRLRAMEAAGQFDAAFVADARAVYQTNDQRAALKKSINLRSGSAWIEEKQHPEYRHG